MKKLPNIICPNCSKQNTWHSENQFRPFCSHRCKLIDLGEWASETRKIPGVSIDPDLGIAVYNEQDVLYSIDFTIQNES